jgi:hypothetical protein
MRNSDLGAQMMFTLAFSLSCSLLSHAAQAEQHWRQEDARRPRICLGAHPGIFRKALGALHVSTRALHSVPLGESEMPRHEISQARAALRPLLSFKLQKRSLRLHSPQARAALRLLLSFKLKSKLHAVTTALSRPIMRLLSSSASTALSRRCLLLSRTASGGVPTAAMCMPLSSSAAL